MRYTFIPKPFRILLGLAALIGAVGLIALPIIQVDGSWVVPIGGAMVLFFIGGSLLYSGFFKSIDEIIDESDFSHIPYADGTPTEKPKSAKPAPQTIEEKLAARKERLEKAKREGKI